MGKHILCSNGATISFKGSEMDALELQFNQLYAYLHNVGTNLQTKDIRKHIADLLDEMITSYESETTVNSSSDSE